MQNRERLVRLRAEKEDVLLFLFHMLLRCVPDTEKSLPQHEAVVHPKTTIPYVTDRIQESFKGNKVVMKSTEMRGFHSLCPEGFRFI